MPANRHPWRRASPAWHRGARRIVLAVRTSGRNKRRCCHTSTIRRTSRPRSPRRWSRRRQRALCRGWPDRDRACTGSNIASHTNRSRPRVLVRSWWKRMRAKRGHTSRPVRRTSASTGAAGAASPSPATRPRLPVRPGGDPSCTHRGGDRPPRGEFEAARLRIGSNARATAVRQDIPEAAGGGGAPSPPAVRFLS